MAYLPYFDDTYRQLLKAYVFTKTLESFFNIGTLAMPFVNVTIHSLPLAWCILRRSPLHICPTELNVLIRVFAKSPAVELFDLFEIAVRNGLDWRIFVDNSA